jgi:SAM-dependent methyltransferase
VPRLLIGNARAVLARSHRLLCQDPRFQDWCAGSLVPPPDLQLVERFDREWQRFSAMRKEERAQLFASYFDLIPDETLRQAAVVLDAGCGSGRWAAEVATRASLVLAVDLGQSVEIARKNTPTDRVAVIQADLREPAVAAGSVDLAYSLGVLHHMEETEQALARIVATLRHGGILLIYLYYALDDRGRVFRAAFRLVDLMRRLISRLPPSFLPPLTAVIALIVYWPLARLSRVLELAGLRSLARRSPLAFYRTLSFRSMWNDSLDRFGTRLEKRFTSDQIVDLLMRAGLNDIRLSAAPPYWRAAGRKP